MFIVGGALIARAGVLGSRAIERGIEPGTLELAQVAERPLIVALAMALVIALIMRETYRGRMPADSGRDARCECPRIPQPRDSRRSSTSLRWSTTGTCFPQ
jgi:hypothetical protein